MGTQTVLVTGSCIRSAIWKLLADTSVGIQVLAISVSYERHLLTILVSNPNALRGAVLCNPRYSPLLGQITRLARFAPKCFRGGQILLSSFPRDLGGLKREPGLPRAC
jgi:hypothetical protein